MPNERVEFCFSLFVFHRFVLINDLDLDRFLTADFTARHGRNQVMEQELTEKVKVIILIGRFVHNYHDLRRLSVAREIAKLRFLGFLLFRNLVFLQRISLLVARITLIAICRAVSVSSV